MKPSEINQKLADQVLDVCHKLLPNGKQYGQYYECGSINGEPGRSLKVFLSGKNLGRFADYASMDDSGDLIDLWCKTRGISFKDALQEIKQHLGIYDIKREKYDTKPFKEPQKPKCIPITPESRIGRWYKEERRISIDTLKKYKISMDGDKVIFPYIYDGKLKMYKIRDMGKEWVDGKKYTPTNKDPYKCLFGWQCIPDDSRSVCIVEGENDPLACYEQGIPALSVPFGGGGGRKQLDWIENEYHNLERFEEIYLMLDMDEPGRQAVEEIGNRLGRHRCYVVELPMKDAGDCHINGVDIFPYVERSKTMDPEELKNSGEFKNEVWDEFYKPTEITTGLKLPWPSTYNKIRFRPSEVTLWTGFNGSGKSQILGHIFADFIKQSSRVCIASMEMKPRKTIMRMMRQVSGYQTPPQEIFDDIDEWISRGLWIFNIRGTAKAEKMFQVFEYARKRYGVRQFMIDSLAKCGIASDDYNGQKDFIDQCGDFANDYDAHIHIVAHARKKEDESKIPNKMDVRGPGELTDMVDNVITVWRNKPKEIKIEKCEYSGQYIPDDLKYDKDCILICSKQRNYDWEGAIALWFDKLSYQYRDDYEKPLKEYLK